MIVIVGPTAIGKTEYSIKIAKKYRTEIISCDSRQFYKELKIGTAPPNDKQLKEVKHHFIHNLSIHDNYSAGAFEKDAIKKIQEIHKKKDNIILVGGSGLYVDAVCNGFNIIPTVSKEIRQDINLLYENKGIEWLKEKVKNIDPNSFTKENYNNPQRLLRILEVYYQTKKPLSFFHNNKKKEREFIIQKIGLKIEREKLYDKINQRVDKMIKNGLVKEVTNLIQYKNINALQTVGYKEIFEFLENKISLENAIEKIKRNTRRFAKRQITWFKKDQSISWHNYDEIVKINEL
ncbi:MAG: tRNA (adenosine(37)-N6)-dimethylallyltransferase MiaA [Flavobacteriales bacterium]|nr:tRNA (adenosine(37)-N6)-dimethylallyltransferase MiaA [Flavobacteriales bacterium]